LATTGKLGQSKLRVLTDTIFGNVFCPGYVVDGTIASLVIELDECQNLGYATLPNSS
jgi:hypothetical protein